MKTRAERIKELREAHGLFEAKLIVERQDLDSEIANAKTVEDLKSILWSLNARID